MAMEEGIRVRIGFVDRNILNKSQKLEGLKRCWLLLPREIVSISALASLIIHKFSLQDTCPYGLLLFMDDFVLPPFESTCILKDNDIIRVKRKGGKLISYDTNHIEDSETMEKWPLLTGAKHLAIQGPETDTHTEHEEDFEGVLHLENSSCGNMSMKKKRKRADNLHSSKVKKTGAKLIGYVANHIEDPETMEKQSLLTGAKLLATQGPEKDTRTEYEEDFEGALHLENSSCGGNMSTKKKRKHAENLHSSKVKGKGAKLISNGANHIEDPETMEKQSLRTGAKLLATQGPEKDTLTEDEEAFEGAVHLENSLCGNTSTKKRKHADNLHSSKRKKARSIGAEKHLMATNDGVEKSVQTREKEGIHCDGDISQKSHTKKDKQTNVKSRSDVIASPSVSNEVENVEPMPIEEGGDRLPVNSQNRVDTSHILDGTEKFPSRSARRKKAKRKWLWELVEFQKKELIQKQTLENDIHKKSPEHQLSNESAGLAVSQKKEIIQKKMLEKDTHKKLPEHQHPNQNTDTDDEVVPVVIKPGHIRFEPLAKEQRNWELNDPVETFQWTGTTSKKKGQKWGLERTSVCRRNDDKGSDVNSVGKPDIEEGELVDAPVDFEKLLPLSGRPKEGDVIVYRMLELSSSWCPELSSFRVGKISSYDPLSGKVMLLPVKEYPVLDENKDEEAAELLLGASLYNSDGSLEIDFASLVDVRILNHDKEEPMTVVMNGSNEPPASSQPQEPGVSNGSKPNAEVAPSPIKENEVKMTAWDDIEKALSEKKEQLLQKNGGGTQETSVKSGWSSRAMRSSALGPTMALLREKNQL